jgi:hypothetical protein
MSISNDPLDAVYRPDARGLSVFLLLLLGIGIQANFSWPPTTIQMVIGIGVGIAFLGLYIVKQYCTFITLSTKMGVKYLSLINGLFKVSIPVLDIVEIKKSDFIFGDLHIRYRRDKVIREQRLGEGLFPRKVLGKLITKLRDINSLIELDDRAKNIVNGK